MARHNDFTRSPGAPGRSDGLNPPQGGPGRPAPSFQQFQRPRQPVAQQRAPQRPLARPTQSTISRPRRRPVGTPAEIPGDVAQRPTTPAGGGFTGRPPNVRIGERLAGQGQKLGGGAKAGALPPPASGPPPPRDARTGGLGTPSDTRGGLSSLGPQFALGGAARPTNVQPVTPSPVPAGPPPPSGGFAPGEVAGLTDVGGLPPPVQPITPGVGGNPLTEGQGAVPLSALGGLLERQLANPSRFGSEEFKKSFEGFSAGSKADEEEAANRARALGASRGVFFGTAGVRQEERSRRPFQRGRADLATSLLLNQAQTGGADQRGAIDQAFRFGENQQLADRFAAGLGSGVLNQGLAGAPDINTAIGQFGQLPLSQGPPPADFSGLANLTSGFGGGGAPAGVPAGGNIQPNFPSFSFPGQQGDVGSGPGAGVNFPPFGGESGADRVGVEGRFSFPRRETRQLNRTSFRGGR